MKTKEKNQKECLSDKDLQNVSGGMDGGTPSEAINPSICLNIKNEKECLSHDNCRWYSKNIGRSCRPL